MASCAVPCYQVQQELAQLPPPAAELPDGRYALGLSMATGFVNRALEQILEDGRGFSQELPIRVGLPRPLNAMAGKASISLAELRMVGSGACTECVRLDVITDVQVRLVGVDLPRFQARAIAEVRLQTPSVGSQIRVLAGLEEFHDLRIDLERGRESDILRDAVLAVAEQVGGPLARGAAQLLLSTRALQGLQTELDEALSQVVGRGLGKAVTRAFPEELELTRFEAPAIGDQRLSARRLELHSADRGLFLGIDLESWPEGQWIGASWHEEDLTVVASTSSLVQLLELAMEGGVLPRQIDPRGKSEPEGRLRLQPRSVLPNDDGFELHVRMWKTQGNCGWVDLSAQLSSWLEDDQFHLHLDDFRPQQARGSGRSLASGLRLHNAFSRDNLEVARSLAASTEVTVLGRAARWKIRELRGAEERAELALSLLWTSEDPMDPPPGDPMVQPPGDPVTNPPDDPTGRTSDPPPTGPPPD
jgi:hypothetical protein